MNKLTKVLLTLSVLVTGFANADWKESAKNYFNRAKESSIVKAAELKTFSKAHPYAVSALVATAVAGTLYAASKSVRNNVNSKVSSAKNWVEAKVGKDNLRKAAKVTAGVAAIAAGVYAWKKYGKTISSNVKARYAARQAQRNPNQQP